ncbi:MAG: hypothetical protein ACFFER_05560 [Candidatus Thorarchaeota archaeon]
MGSNADDLLKALIVEYEQHWEHCRHGIDKQYQAFNFYLVTIALLVSAISFLADPALMSVSVPLFMAVGTVSFVLSAGVLMLLISQRRGYVLHRYIVLKLREKISKIQKELEPEVKLFKKGAPRVLEFGSAATFRYIFVILIASLVVALCTYLSVSIPTVTDGFSIEIEHISQSFEFFISSFLILFSITLVESYRRSRKLADSLDKYYDSPDLGLAKQRIWGIVLIIVVIVTYGLILIQYDFSPIFNPLFESSQLIIAACLLILLFIYPALQLLPARKAK